MNKTGDYNTTGEGGRYADSSSKTRGKGKEKYDRPSQKQERGVEQGHLRLRISGKPGRENPELKVKQRL